MNLLWKSTLNVSAIITFFRTLNLWKVLLKYWWMFFFFPAISSNIHCYSNNTFHKFKVLKKVIMAETFNVDFHNKFIKFGLFCFFYFLHTVGFNFLIYVYCPSGYSVRQWPGRPGFNPRSSHIKDLKNGTWCLLA